MAGFARFTIPTEARAWFQLIADQVDIGRSVIWIILEINVLIIVTSH